jgi:CRP-like cAMP-binding protein
LQMNGNDELRRTAALIILRGVDRGEQDPVRLSDRALRKLADLGWLNDGMTEVAPPGRQRLTQRNLLLAALRPADFLLFAPDLKTVPIAQGDVLQEAGEAIEYVYFPQSGIISLLTVMQNGSTVETAIVGREGAMGAMSGLGSRIAPHRAVVKIEGTASRIAAAAFETAVNGSAAIKDLTVRYSDFLMMMSQQSAGCSALHPLEKRLCQSLLQAQDRNDSKGLPLTQGFLSQLLGVRRTTLTVIARKIQAAGLIRYRRGRIEIVDRGGLEAKACECYELIRRRAKEVVSEAIA